MFLINIWIKETPSVLSNRVGILDSTALDSTKKTSYLDLERDLLDLPRDLDLDFLLFLLLLLDLEWRRWCLDLDRDLVLLFFSFTSGSKARVIKDWASLTLLIASSISFAAVSWVFPCGFTIALLEWFTLSKNICEQF